MSPIIKVKYCYEGNAMAKEWELKSIPNGDWVDLRCGVDINIKAGGVYTIPLGGAMELPLGYEVHIAPRSSILPLYGLIGQYSIIDHSYRGTDDIWHFICYATRDTNINRGDRIAQFRIVKSMEPPEFIEVNTLRDFNRGDIGSTGKN